MSDNPYVQVALTYVRRPFSSLIGVLLTVSLCLLAVPVLLFRPGMRAEKIVFGVAAFLPILFAFYAVHLKRQLTNDLTPLTPEFRRIHLTVAGVIGLFMAVLIPAALAWQAGLPCVGLVSLTALLFGSVLWGVVNASSPVGPIIVIAWFALLASEQGRTCLWRLLLGQFEPFALLMLIIGATAVVLAGRQLLQLNEDMPEYHANTSWGACPRQAWRGGDRRLLRRSRDRFVERTMGRLIRDAQRAPVSRWSRICRWQAGMVAGGVAWIMSLWVLVFGVVCVWLGWRCNRQDPNVNPMIKWATLMLMVMPLTALLQTALSGKYKLVFESSLPVSRTQYIRELGLAAAWSHFHVWAVMGFVTTFGCLVFGKQPATLTALALMLAETGAFQIVAFGGVMWLAQCRHRGWGVVPGGVFYGMMLIMSEVSSPTTIFWIAGIGATLGLLITWDAYRRWLVADLDSPLS